MMSSYVLVRDSALQPPSQPTQPTHKILRKAKLQHITHQKKQAMVRLMNSKYNTPQHLLLVLTLFLSAFIQESTSFLLFAATKRTKAVVSPTRSSISGRKSSSSLYYRDDDSAGSHDLGLPKTKTKWRTNPRLKSKTKTTKQPTGGRNGIRYKLHSNRVSELNPSSSTAADVMTALKRVQKTKDSDDLRVIAEFLLRGVGDSFAYGYKGSLLARLAVTSLRLEEHDIAQEAIAMRRNKGFYFEPFESAAILRGLLRMHRTEEAFELLETELSATNNNNNNENSDRIAHRSRSLASIISRGFFENDPLVAFRACQLLADLAPVVHEVGLSAKDLDMPWVRILAGAKQCMAGEPINDRENLEAVILGVVRSFPQEPGFQESSWIEMTEKKISQTIK